MPQPLQRFNGLLSRMVPQENYGGLLSPQDQRAAANAYRAQLASGLLSAAGPQRMPISLGQALGAAIPQAMQARDYRAETGLRNDQLRRQIDNENRQNAARSKFSGLLRGAGGPEGEMLGLLAELDPGLALQAMSGGNDRADPNVIRALTLAGIDPQSPEGQAIVIKSLTGGDQGGDLAAQLLIDERQARLDREKREAQVADEDRARARTTLQNTVGRSLAQTEKIAHLTEDLEGSFLEAGVPASSWRRTGAGLMAGLGEAVGIDTSKLQTDLSKYDQLKKNLSDQLINLMATGGLGEATNSKLEQYQNALANTETSPGAIMAIQANIAELLLDEADSQGFEVEGRDKIESNIEAWRSYQSAPGEAVVDAPAVVRRVADIGRMSLEQLEQLNPATLTKELRDAAADRWDELNAR